MFAAIEQKQPKGVKYASSRLADSTTYIILLALENPAENLLPAIPEFREFQASTRGWLSEPTIPEPLTVIGSYRLCQVVYVLRFSVQRYALRSVSIQ